MTKKQEEESACERVPDESEGKPDQEQELVEEIESFNDALSEIGKQHKRLRTHGISFTGFGSRR